MSYTLKALGNSLGALFGSIEKLRNAKDGVTLYPQLDGTQTPVEEVPFFNREVTDRIEAILEEMERYAKSLESPPSYLVDLERALKEMHALVFRGQPHHVWANLRIPERCDAPAAPELILPEPVREPDWCRDSKMPVDPYGIPMRDGWVFMHLVAATSKSDKRSLAAIERQFVKDAKDYDSFRQGMLALSERKREQYAAKIGPLFERLCGAANRDEPPEIARVRDEHQVYCRQHEAMMKLWNAELDRAERWKIAEQAVRDIRETLTVDTSADDPLTSLPEVLNSTWKAAVHHLEHPQTCPFTHFSADSPAWPVEYGLTRISQMISRV